MFACFSGVKLSSRIESRIVQGVFAAIVLFGCLPRLSADVIFFQGNLKTDATVTACGSDPTCTLTSDGDYAQFAAAVYTFTVSTTSTMEAITYSYGGGTSETGAVVAAGGLSPYLSLFDASGNFLASTFYSGCPGNTNPVTGNCYDVELDGGTLNPGDYEIAITAYENMSFAENYGSGNLTDGFTGLGNLDYNGQTLDYAFDVILTDTNTGGGGADTPEPASALLLATAGAAMIFMCKKRMAGL